MTNDDRRVLSELAYQARREGWLKWELPLYLGGTARARGVPMDEVKALLKRLDLYEP